MWASRRWRRRTDKQTSPLGSVWRQTCWRVDLKTLVYRWAQHSMKTQQQTFSPNNKKKHFYFFFYSPSYVCRQNPKQTSGLYSRIFTIVVGGIEPSLTCVRPRPRNAVLFFLLWQQILCVLYQQLNTFFQKRVEFWAADSIVSCGVEGQPLSGTEQSRMCFHQSSLIHFNPIKPSLPPDVGFSTLRNFSFHQKFCFVFITRPRVRRKIQLFFTETRSFIVRITLPLLVLSLLNQIEC